MNPPAVPGLREEGTGHSPDVARPAPWLRAHVSGCVGPVSVHRFAGGESNPTCFLQALGHRYVLRRKPTGTLLPSAHAIEREFRVLQALRGSDVPVPAAYALCADPTRIGSPFYVMEYVPGRIFWDAVLTDARREQGRALWRSRRKRIEIRGELLLRS